MTSETDIIDLKARSLEGRGLSQRAGEHWIEIQKNTFMNWVNLQIQGSGYSVTDFEQDFDDGVKLCALVESLQNRKIGRVIKKPINQHQSLENVTLALRAIADDNVRLVNIGSEDIVNGSLKLILGLIWHLILRYQIGKTKVPPKKLMLAWLQAVIPENHISNFTSDWNDGIALHALIDYCQPGLAPNWRQLNRSDKLHNCKEAMSIAQRELNIPIVVRPEDFCSPHLDELSGMTYLSYYMMVDSPGYLATRREIRALLQQGTIDNFQTDWNDGHLLCNLVKSVGGDVPGWPQLTHDHVTNLQTGIDAAKRLGIEPIFSAKEMADPEVEHLGIMAYAAHFRHHKPVKIVKNKATMNGDFNNIYVKQEKHFYINAEHGTSQDAIRPEVIGPDSIVPVRTKWSGNRCDCYFTPTETGQHKLNVYCDNENIPGCPVTFKVHADRSKVKFNHLDRAVVGLNSELKVDTSAAGQGDIRIEAISPSGHAMNLPVMYKGGVHSANFTPNEVGDWRINMVYDGEHIQGSPYTVKVFDPSLVRISNLSGGKVGHQLAFHADSREAGEGEVTCQVLYGGIKVPCHMKKDDYGKYTVDFTPQGPGTYIVHAYMNDIEVRGSPYKVDIIDTSRVTVTGEGLSLVPVNTPAVFTIHTNGAGGGNVDVDISGPNGVAVPYDLSTDSTGDTVIKYLPIKAGEYNIHVKYCDHNVTGSPFIAKAYNIGAIYVTPLQDGFINQPMHFTIDVGEAGEGQLQIMVNQGNTPNDVEAEGTGHYKIKFIPTVPGKQVVDILFNEKPLPCSPLTCVAQDLSASLIGLHQLIPVHQSSSFTIQSQANIANLSTDIIITAPTGENIPARLLQQPDGDYKVEWTPNKPGRHSVDVMYGGQQIQGSPFYIDVFDIHKIRVNNFFHGDVNEKAGFKLDCTHAGKSEHDIRIMSPSGRNVPYNIDEHTPLEYSVWYTPIESGQHKIFVSYGGMELNGSPFHQEISEGTLPTAHGEGLHKGEEDKPATFIIDSRNLRGEPTVQVDGPNAIAKCSIDPQPDGQYRVTYIPVEVGLFDVYVRWNGKEIPGSPFHPKVVDPRKVKVVGGWHHYMDGQDRIHLVVGEEKKIPFDISEAGPGHMRAEVKSPSAFIPVEVDNEHKGKCVVKFVPKEEGLHHIHLYWSDHPLVNSPYVGFAVSGAADPSKVWLSGQGLKEAVIREEAEFIIDGSQAGPGEPEVELTGVRAEIQVFKTPLGGGKYRCTYIPVIPGAYLLNISWNGRQLRGAPYKVNVIGASYPNRVIVNGEGLKGGLMGNSLDFRIDTRKAGPGELTAYCMGPNKVAYCELSDHHDGTYRLVVRPQETGKHVLQIKYGGEHVQGSPYAFKVTAQPDASKVRVSGPGVEHGILATFQSQFIVETKGAGAGQLTVRIRGPKGAFQVEMYRESQKDRTILCRYYPSITGLYIINVRWSGVDVPGSPFHVQILDTQQELEQVLHEQSFSSSGGRHHMVSHSSNSFHNTSLNSSNQLRYSTGPPNGQHHNISRSSGYYHQWREDM
uniref:Calponin-homology (CH) domain-containing protein n=1 Tax=Biomphalaria glabrata TaxID=6526 RepID=A0A2C9JF60_BIOGL